jgi:tetratricopeptide (TPR) repeat protein/methionine synthase II (cobalamin-independent)
LAGSYLKSLQLAKQLEERAREATRNKELAEKEYEALEEFLERCRENDIDLSEAEKDVSSYTASIGVKDYQSALGHAKKAMETAKSAYASKAKEVVDSVEALISHLRGPGTEPKSVMNLLETSKDQLGKGEVEDAMKSAKSAYDAAERAVHEYVSDMFSQAQETIMQAKETGDDVSIFDDILARAKSALESQDYEGAISNVREALEGAGDNLRAQSNAAISTAEELVVAGEELEADVTRVKNYIEKAHASLENLRFKESMAYAKRAENEADNAISSRVQELLRATRESIKKLKTVRDDVSGPQQLLEEAQTAVKDKDYIEAIQALNLARERVDEMKFQSVLAVISEARDQFVLAKKVGVDLTKPIMLLNTARDHLKRGNFEESVRYAEEGRQVVEEALSVFYNARDQIAQLGDAMKSAASLGADIAPLKNYLAEARKHFEARDYARTVETTKQGIGEARKIAYDTAMALIDTADKSVKLAKKLGADIAEPEGVLHKALESLSKDEMAESVTYAKSSLDASNAAMTRVLSDRLQSIDQFVKGYAETADVTGVNDLIAEARQSVASNSFERASDLLSQVAHRIEDSAKEECARLLDMAASKLEEIAAVDVDVSDLELLLKRAYDALSDKIYEDAAARAREVIAHADEMTVKLVQTEFSAVKDTLEEARAVGIDLEDSKSKLMEARGKASKKEYNQALRVVKGVRSDLLEKIARHDKIKDKIRKAEELIAEAEKSKADVSGSQRRLDLAKREFEKGNHEKADALLDECLAEAERTLAMYLAAKFILNSKEVVDLAGTHGIDVSSSSELLSNAKQQMKEKRYDDALATAKRAEEDAKKTISSALGGMLTDLQRLVADAKNVGIDTQGPERLTEKALSLSRAGDFVEALKCVSSAREDIEHVKNLSAQAAVEIRSARSAMKNVETLGIDSARSRELLDQAVDALTRHQYAIATELAKKSAGISIEMSRSKIKETLDAFKERVDKAASEGAPMGLAERCVAEGLAAFDEGRHDEALKLALKCESELERADLQRSISTRAVEMARRRLNDAVSEGVGSDRLSELVTKAELLLREGKYVDALSAAIESGDELLQMREAADGIRIEFSTATERVERLKKIGIDTSECDDILQMAQEFLADNETERCRDALKRCAATAASLFEKSTLDIMEKDRLMIESAKSMGINTKACEDLMEVVKTSFDEKLWDFAHEQAVACKDKCLELIAKKISNLIGEIQTRLSALSHMGAAVTSIEELVGKAREAGAAGDIDEAFNLLMEVDNKIALTEAAHKKYLDITIAAESAIENLGRFGLSKKEAERLLDMAEIEREKDYDSAIELVAEALDTASNMMESASPEIAISLDAGGLQEGAEGEVKVILKNEGKSMANDVKVTLSGDLRASDTPALSVLKPGAQDTVAIMVTPKSSGSLTIVVDVTGRRHFDGKPVEFRTEETVDVYQAGPAFRIGRATEVTRCSLCQGKIKQGFDTVSCRCGAQLHLTCAKRVSKCPSCGQRYEF